MLGIEWSDVLASNDFFQGGLILAALAACWGILLRYGTSLGFWLIHRVAITITVDNQNILFDAISAWFDANKASDKLRRIRYDSQQKGDFTASPNSGYHIVKIRGRYTLLHRHIVESQATWGKPYENFTITIPFITRKGIDSWLTEVMDLYECRSERLPSVWHWKNGYWERLQRVPNRPLHTVSLSGSKLQNLLSDVKTFLASRDRYVSMGVPWRRGYLFYGEPGTGKSTTAIALANETRMSVAYLSLAARGLDDSTLVTAITSLPRHTILLLEDIDAAMPDRKKTAISNMNLNSSSPDDEFNEEDRSSQLTLSGLLNALDGIVSPEGMVVIMTTNYQDRLDHALIRPGRADYPVHFDLAGADQANDIARRITDDQDLVEAIVEDVKEHGPVAHAFIQQAALGASNPMEIKSILYKARERNSELKVPEQAVA